MHDLCKTNQQFNGCKDIKFYKVEIMKNQSDMEQFNQNKKIMKGKYLIGALLMAIFGAFIALFVYTRLIEKSSDRVGKDTATLNISEARPIFTSLPQQDNQVDLTYASEQTVHGVVHVTTKSLMSPQESNPIMEFFYGNAYSRPREVKGYGSGVIISADGYIITNNHVIENAEEVNVKLNDNREFKAQVIGRDPNTDIAIIKVKAENLPFIKYGDSDQLRLGEWVLAVGNPFNLTSTVTAGIISAKGRDLDPGRDPYKIESYIQTDAALNPGNSGGALVNTRGLLVGITSAIISPTSAYAGYSFAIPINIVRKVVEDLKQYGEVQRAFIGVGIQDVTPELIDKENLKLDAVKGVYVNKIDEGGAAADAGLKEKDVIIKFNGISVGTINELQEQVGKYRPGEKADVTFMRNGKENTISVTLKNSNNTTKFVGPGEGAGEVFGAHLESLTQEERNEYRLDYGVKVTDLNDGRFKDLGIRKGYIITSVNGKRVKSASDVKNFTNNGQNLTSIEGYQSNGYRFSFQFGK
jgi:serine protease Do